jgi:hypothetical protein
MGEYETKTKLDLGQRHSDKSRVSHAMRRGQWRMRGMTAQKESLAGFVWTEMRIWPTLSPPGKKMAGIPIT